MIDEPEGGGRLDPDPKAVALHSREIQAEHLPFHDLRAHFPEIPLWLPLPIGPDRHPKEAFPSHQAAQTASQARMGVQGVVPGLGLPAVGSDELLHQVRRPGGVAAIEHQPRAAPAGRGNTSWSPSRMSAPTAGSRFEGFDSQLQPSATSTRASASRPRKSWAPRGGMRAPRVWRLPPASGATVVPSGWSTTSRDSSSR